MLSPREELIAKDLAEFYFYLTDRLHPEHDFLWNEHLLSDELLERTREAINSAGTKVRSGAAGLKAAEADIEARRARGQLNEVAFLEAKAVLGKKKHRHFKFKRLLDDRTRQVQAAEMDAARRAKDAKQRAHQEHQARNRDQTRAILSRLALAVRAHQHVCTRGSRPVTDADRALWAVLEDERVPFAGSTLSLAEAIDHGRWAAPPA